jgi:hypothetical protein
MRLMVLAAAMLISSGGASCVSADRSCSPQNCAGCCDAEGACVPQLPPVRDTQCGAQGSRCERCTDQNKTCQGPVFHCVLPTLDAGSGTSLLPDCDLTAPACATGSACTRYDLTQPTLAKCFPGACHLTDTSGCGPGSKCAYLQNGARSCVASSGTSLATAACQLETDCAAGHSCQVILGVQQCVKFCDASALTCPAGQSCSGALVLKATDEKPGICSSPNACDVLAQNCRDTEGCYQDGPATVCLPAGQAAPGSPCQPQASNSASVCQKASSCLLEQSGNTTGVCRSNCNLDAGTPGCNLGLCTAIGRSFGVCL